MAPECMEGEAPTAASDIYSLSMCIIEVLSGEIPFSDKIDYHVAPFVALGYHPKLPEAVQASEKQLISQMWLYDPTKRVNLASVIERLKVFAERSNASKSEIRDPTSHASAKPESASFDLENCVFAELGYPIPEFLQRLKAKCDASQGNRVSALYILERLIAVHAALRDPSMTTRHCSRQVLSGAVEF